MDCCKQKTIRQIVIMFKAVAPQQLADAGPQLQKVLAFRSDIEQQKTHLFHSFDTVDALRRLLRKHLAAWLRTEEAGGVLPRAEPMVGPEVPGSGPDTLEAKTPDLPDDSVIAGAWALANKGRLTEAEVEFARSIVGRQLPQPLIEYGRFLRRLGRLDQATVMFRQEDHPASARAYGNLGNVLEIRGDFAGAEQKYRKALEIDERLGRLEGMANDYVNLGNALWARGDLAGAEQMQRKALEIDERLGRLEGMANAYGNLGNVLQTRGDLDGAEQMYRKSLEIEERLGRLEGMASDYGNLGNVLQTRGDLDGAEQKYRKSLEIEERLGRLEGMARQYGNVGIVLQDRGDLDGAERMYRKALEINERLGRLEGMAIQHGNLGSLLKARRDLDGAEQMYRKSLEIEERLGRLEGMANEYGHLGMVFKDRGNLDGAEQMLRKALESAERLGSAGMVTRFKSFLASLREQAPGTPANPLGLRDSRPDA
jgi:tetratricopeptide (TPR) repeat protein